MIIYLFFMITHNLAFSFKSIYPTITSKPLSYVLAVKWMRIPSFHNEIINVSPGNTCDVNLAPIALTASPFPFNL